MTRVIKKALSMFVIGCVAAGMVLNMFGSVALANSYRVDYVVNRGETLKDITRYFGMDYELVAAMNNLDPEKVRLVSGQKIYLPLEPEMKYIIKQGDTLWEIARKYRTTVDSLTVYNRITNPGRLQIGTEISIPVVDSEQEKTVFQVAALRVEEASRGAVSSFLMPVIGVISSPYGWRKSGFHHGLDIAAKTGTPIRAVKAGQVDFCGRQSVYGNTVIISHGAELQTLYGHASRIYVKNDQWVSKGQIIATVGSTGRSTGPHLHFAVKVKDKFVDPKRYLPSL